MNKGKGIPLEECGISVEDLTPLHLPPVTAYDYLYRVRLEAQASEQVVIAENRDTLISAKVDCPLELDIRKQYFEQEPFRDTVDPRALPSQEMITSFIQKFAFASKNFQDYSAQLIESQVETREDFNIENRPSIQIIAQSSQQQIMQHLEFITERLHQQEFNQSIGHWIFSLLLNCNTLKTSTEISTLRQLCIALINKRQEMFDGSLDLPILLLNMLITIVTHVFRQGDLQTTFATRSE